jgi:hypothetical protein
VEVAGTADQVVVEEVVVGIADRSQAVVGLDQEGAEAWSVVDCLISEEHSSHWEVAERHHCCIGSVAVVAGWVPDRAEAAEHHIFQAWELGSVGCPEISV